MSDFGIEQEQQAVSHQQRQVEEILEYIEDLMAEDDYDKAQEVLTNALRLEHFDLRIYERYAFVLRMVGNAKAAELFEQVAMTRGDNPEALYTVGSTLMKDKMYSSAINPFRRVVELVPMAVNVNFELGYAYLKEFELKDALTYFQAAHEYGPSPTTAFYVAYTSLLLSDLNTTKSLIPYMEEEYAKIGEEPVMLNILKEMIERFEAFPPTDVRDWHFVQYGQPLLRTTTEDLGENEDLNGRYVFINYGFGNVAYVLKTFERLVKEVPGYPEYKFIIPASNRIVPVAYALSAMLGLPLAAPEAIETGDPGLIVTGWTEDLDRVAEHVLDKPHIGVFSFSLGWTLQANICPDVVGYFDQAHRLPWEETMEVLENGERRPRAALEESGEELGARIVVRANEIDAAELDSIIDYYKERAHMLKVGKNANVPRLGFQIESPIQSMRMFV